jgi:hypothetical protein
MNYAFPKEKYKMPKKSKPQVNLKTGNISGSQIVIGDGNNVISGDNNRITQKKNIVLSPAELKTLQDKFSGLQKEIESSLTPEKKEEALQKADELQKAVLAGKPDTSTMVNVRNWFVKNLPGIAGTVTGMLVNPIVGKLVEAAGDMAVKEFRQKLGEG